MVVKAAFGGSTNLLDSSPGHCTRSGLAGDPRSQTGSKVNRLVPRLVDALPNGPRNFATVQVFLAGGVPEVMLKLREHGLLDDEGEDRERRNARTRASIGGATAVAALSCGASCKERDGIDPDDVIMSPDRARSRGLTSAVCFPIGNLAPEGSVVKSTAIDPSLVGEDNVYRHTGPARVFVTEAAAIQAIKARQDFAKAMSSCSFAAGPLGAGMQEIYQITSALKQLPHCKHVAVLTDARFSGVSTGACIGHISPEALAGGPIGKVREGDQIEIVIDRARLDRLCAVGWANGEEQFSAEEGTLRLSSRSPRPDLAPHPAIAG